jgi:hypothetical protein
MTVDTAQQDLMERGWPALPADRMSVQALALPQGTAEQLRVLAGKFPGRNLATTREGPAA